MVQELLEKGASVDNGERTTLILAVIIGHAKVVQILLAHGASKDSRDYRRRTPLMHAAYEGQKDIVQFWLENGARVDLRDWDR